METGTVDSSGHVLMVPIRSYSRVSICVVLLQ